MEYQDAVTLVAAVIEQAYRDTLGPSKTNCLPRTRDSHPPFTCAQPLVESLVRFVHSRKEVDAGDIAMEFMRIINGGERGNPRQIQSSVSSGPYPNADEIYVAGRAGSEQGKVQRRNIPDTLQERRFGKTTIRKTASA